MQSVMGEAPHHWPHGLSMNNFDQSRGEGVFLVRSKQANLAPVGFVGWQERREGTEKVGYYSVGILPEHRGQGYAKEAVQKLINIKSGNVNRVVALIEKGNAPSHALAASLGVTVKSAAVGGTLIKSFLKQVATGSGRALDSEAVRLGGAALVGGGLGYAESKAMDGGHISDLGLPITNAVLLAPFFSKRLRKDFFGSSNWRDTNSKQIAQFLGAKTLGTAGVIGADKGIKLMGHAERAAAGAGDLGEGLSSVGKALTTSSSDVTKTTGDISKVTSYLTDENGGTGIKSILRNVNRATEGQADAAGKMGETLTAVRDAAGGLKDVGAGMKGISEQAGEANRKLDTIFHKGGPFIEKTLAGAEQQAENANTALQSLTNHLGKAVGGKDTGSGILAALDKYKQYGATTLGVGAGGSLGYLLANMSLSDLPKNHPNYNRNRRLRTLAAILGAGVGGAVGNKL